MKLQRKNVFSIAAIGAAAIAISTGAWVSNQAMASTTTPKSGKVTMVSVGGDGKSLISCTFDDVKVPKEPFGIDISGGQTTDSQNAVGGWTTGSQIVGLSANGALPKGASVVTIPGAEQTMSGVSTPLSSEGFSQTISADSGKTGKATVVPDQARPGSVAECSALRSLLPR